MITNIAEGELIASSSSFLSGEPSYYNVETLEPCTVLSITRANLERAYQEARRSKAGEVGDDLFCAAKSGRVCGVYADGYPGAVPAVHQANPGLLMRSAAEVPCLSEYEAGDVQPVKESHKKTPCCGASLDNARPGQF